MLNRYHTYPFISYEQILGTLCYLLHFALVGICLKIEREKNVDGCVVYSSRFYNMVQISFTFIYNPTKRCTFTSHVTFYAQRMYNGIIRDAT